MAELRWNPLLATWTMVATNRQNRPHLPKNWCPFCPGEGKNVPDNFTVISYLNDFPVLSQTPDAIASNSPFFMNEEAYGKCEVILYSPDHEAKLYELADSHLLELGLLWKNRYVELSQDEKIKYIYEFENRGEEVGVTMPHPHGQLYAYSWIPEKIEKELVNSKKYFEKTNRNLFDDMNIAETQYQKRVLFENESFVAYIPYFTDYPFGIFIVAKNKLTCIAQFSDMVIADFMQAIKLITKAFDNVFDRPFPYVMAMHQSPVNSSEWMECDKFYRFHVEFYPPLRAKDKIKWYAGSELGAGAAANPLDVDECAALLKQHI
jgi:UDPglucose--hexose-1-phosphate uridylyltransferase